MVLPARRCRQSACTTDAGFSETRKHRQNPRRVTLSNPTIKGGSIMLKSFPKLASAGAATAVALAISAGAAGAAETNLRIQTHFSPETLSGQMAAEFIEGHHRDVERRDQGRDVLLVRRREVGRDLRRGSHRHPRLRHDGRRIPDGKNPAFQFAGDLAGGYLNPYQQMAWLLHGGGYDQINDLYNAHNMGVHRLVDSGSGVAFLDPPDSQYRGLQELEVPIPAGDDDPGLQEPGRIADRDGLQRDIHGAGIGHHRRCGRGQPDEQRRPGPLRHRRAHELPGLPLHAGGSPHLPQGTSGMRCPHTTRRS